MRPGTRPPAGVRARREALTTGAGSARGRRPAWRWPGLLLLWLASGVFGAPPLLDPNAAEFPDAGLLDLGGRPPAAGEAVPLPFQGPLRVDEGGRFVDQAGQRQRFWGINVASESVFQPPERIDEVVERIRRAGFNLVRIHHIDGTARGIVTGQPDSLTFDAGKLAQLDWWIWRLGQAGLAIYLDLLDYREPVAGDGLPNAGGLGRGAKPYAVFDPALIRQQMRYARALLRDHVNPYTGRCYADDPAVVMLELCDENGLFIRRRDWPTLVEPYRSGLRQQWNAWLAQTYGDTAGLRRAWAASGVADPLQPAESLERGTVRLPELEYGTEAPATTPAQRLRRLQAADAARFAAEVHRRYYRTMRAYLRDELGVTALLTAVGDAEIVPDILTVAEELDFVGCNDYWDHPIFRAGRAWQMPFLFHFRNPLKSQSASSFPAQVALARMAGRPLVVREWNPCFPNPHRAAGMVEATVYACLQDLDAMILFTYGAVPTARRIDFFDVHQDPARWGLAAALGAIYRTGAVSPAKARVEIGYSQTETWQARSYRTPLRLLAQVSAVANRCFGDRLEATADLTVASGRSAAARYTGGPLLLSRNDPSVDLAGRPLYDSPDLLGYPIPLRQGPGGGFLFDGRLLTSGLRQRTAGGKFTLRDLAAAGVEPVGTGDGWAVGFWDGAQRVAGFGPLAGADQARAAADVLRLAYGYPVSSTAFDQHRVGSDTGELLRDAAAGRLLVRSPRAFAVAGELPGEITLDGVRLSSASGRGACVLVSLDGEPLETSRRWLARFVTDARNTDMAMTPPGPQSNPRDFWELTSQGRGPIITGGLPVESGWRLSVGPTLLCAVQMAGGTAEVVRDGDTWQWFVDTPGVRVEVPATTAQALAPDGTRRDLPSPGPWPWPANTALVEAR